MERKSLWQLRINPDETEYIDVYKCYPTLVSFRIHHGGVFVKSPDTQYVRGKTQFVDLVDTDTFSVNELHDMIVEIGYKSPIPTYFHFKFPGKDLNVGLHSLGSDADVLEMLKLVPDCRLFDIYTKQRESRLNTYIMSPGGDKLLLGWIDEEKGKEVNDNQKEQTTLEGKEGGFDKKEETVDDIINEIQSTNNFFDFDPFLGDDYDQMEANLRSDESDEDEFIEKMQNVVDEVEVDMKTFRENIDLDVEWVGNEDVNTDDSNVSGDVDAVDMEDLESNTDDSDMEKERKILLKKMRKEKATVASMEDSSYFYVGQVFGSKDGIKRLIDLHAVHTKRQLHVIKNDSTRIRVVCRGSQPEMNKEYGGGPSNAASGTDKGKMKEVKSSGPPCPWVLLILNGKNDATWMVKTFVDTHKCLQTRKVKACTTSFLSQEIIDTISHNPEIPVKALKIEIERKYGQNFSHMKSFRAKTKALSKVRGNYVEQYNHLRDYVLELQRVMPETTDTSHSSW